MKKGSVKKSFNGTLRPAQAGDLAAIVKVENASFGDERWDADSLDEKLQQSLDSSYTSLVMAFGKAANDNAAPVAGYGLGQLYTSRKGVIISIAVSPEFRGQGLGRKLLDEVSENLRKAGATSILLQVEATNTTAINLYESSGFKKTGTLRDYYGAGRDGNEMMRDLKKKKTPKPLKPA